MLHHFDDSTLIIERHWQAEGASQQVTAADGSFGSD